MQNIQVSVSKPFRVWAAPTTKIEQKLNYFEEKSKFLPQIFFRELLDECLGNTCSPWSRGWDPLIKIKTQNLKASLI